jgi:hypothetical protein
MIDDGELMMNDDECDYPDWAKRLPALKEWALTCALF